MNRRLYIKQYMKMAAQNVILPVWYALCCRKPVVPGLVVFADAHHDSRPANMDLLYERLKRQNGIVLKELYLNYQTHSPAEVLRHMFSFMKWYAQADCVVISDNFLPAASCRKRKKTRVVQLWHACGAFKKFGYDTTDDIPANYRGNVFKNTDLVTVSAERCRGPFASAMKLPREKVTALGVSRTDVYFEREWQERCRKEFYDKYPEAAGKKVVLWAPTFRGNPGAPELIDLDLKRLQQQLGEEWIVLSKVHPHMRERYRETDCKLGTEELFPVIDVLIADYSSLIFEYLLFDKPMVLYAPDLEEYQKKRGFYLNFSEIPGYQVKEEQALALAVKQEYEAYTKHREEKSFKLDDKRELLKKREQFLEEYMSGCDGHATDRIADYIGKRI